MPPPLKNSWRKISWHIFHLSYLKPFPKYLPSLFTLFMSQGKIEITSYMFSCCRFILGRLTTQLCLFQKLILFHTILIDMTRTLLFIVTIGLQPHMVHSWGNHFCQVVFLSLKCQNNKFTHSISRQLLRIWNWVNPLTFFVKSVHQMICDGLKIAVGHVCLPTTTYNVILSFIQRLYRPHRDS